MSENLINVTSANWDAEVINSETPVLVDFWAEWCGPCRAIAPTLDIIAGEQAGKLKIAKVDVDAEADLAATFEIRSIPSLLIFKNGEVVDRLMGAMSKPQLEEKLAAHIG